MSHGLYKIKGIYQMKHQPWVVWQGLLIYLLILFKTLPVWIMIAGRDEKVLGQLSTLPVHLILPVWGSQKSSHWLLLLFLTMGSVWKALVWGTYLQWEWKGLDTAASSGKQVARSRTVGTQVNKLSWNQVSELLVVSFAFVTWDRKGKQCPHVLFNRIQ